MPAGDIRTSRPDKEGMEASTGCLRRTTTSAQSRCCEASANRSASASVEKTPSKDSAKNSWADSMYDASLQANGVLANCTAGSTVAHVTSLLSPEVHNKMPGQAMVKMITDLLLRGIWLYKGVSEQGQENQVAAALLHLLPQPQAQILTFTTHIVPCINIVA